ncbi:MAG TPA: hypothetical protein VGB68_04970, partial [Pyrinomonadaceae bacterium]
RQRARFASQPHGTVFTGRRRFDFSPVIKQARAQHLWRVSLYNRFLPDKFLEKSPGDLCVEAFRSLRPILLLNAKEREEVFL